MDSGATNHVTNEQEFFTVLNDTKTVGALADGSCVEATDIGEGWLRSKFRNGRIQTIKLQNVLYIPEFDGSLLSVRRILSQGHRVVFEGNNCTVYQDKRIIANAISDGNLFKLEAVKTEESVRMTTTMVCLHQWHRRLGHRDPATIKRLVNKGLALGIKIAPCDDKITCEHCIKGKLAQTKFPKCSKKAKGADETYPFGFMRADADYNATR